METPKRLNGATFEEIQSLYFACKNREPKPDFNPFKDLIASIFTSYESLSKSFPLKLDNFQESNSEEIQPIDVRALRRSYHLMLNINPSKNLSPNQYCLELNRKQVEIQDALLTSLRRLVMDYLKNSLDSLQNVHRKNLSKEALAACRYAPKESSKCENSRANPRKEYEEALAYEAYSYFFSLSCDNRKIMLLPTLCLGVSWLPLNLLVALVRLWSTTALLPIEFPDLKVFAAAKDPYSFSWESTQEEIERISRDVMAPIVQLSQENLLPKSMQLVSERLIKQPLNEFTCFLWSLQRVLMHHVTLRCLSIDNETPNDDKELYEASVLLQLIYYASLRAGGMDNAALIEKEQVCNREFIESIKSKYPNYHEVEYLLSNQYTNSSDETMGFNYTPHNDCFNGLNSIGNVLNVKPVNCRSPLIPHPKFINEMLNEMVKAKDDFIHFQAMLVACRNHVRVSQKSFSFMQFPFLLTTSIKSTHLYYDNRLRMLEEKRNAIIDSIFNQDTNRMYLKLNVARNCVVEDALLRLDIICSEDPSSLKKQLFIEFEGEQGVDEGGLSKEFFHLVISKIFNPDYGMFCYNEEQNFFWFNGNHPLVSEMDREYSLVGIILGLAIYNNIILDISFPSVIYRKLIGKLGRFTDLEDFDPTLHRGLTEMLNFEGDEETFQATYRNTFEYLSRDPFGDLVRTDLIENGSQIPLTMDNRKEYVDCLADHILNNSIKSQFNAFRQGFYLVTNGSPLTYLFRSDEIEMLIRGSENYDFEALQKVTTYGPDYSEESPVIKFFWNVVIHKLDNDQRKQLLQFATGSDRIPVGGMSSLKFSIVKQGPDSDRLPTAHTCFNTLLLPDYSDENKLHNLLLIAITHSQGFGLF